MLTDARLCKASPPQMKGLVNNGDKFIALANVSTLNRTLRAERFYTHAPAYIILRACSGVKSEGEVLSQVA